MYSVSLPRGQSGRPGRVLRPCVLSVRIPVFPARGWTLLLASRQTLLIEFNYPREPNESNAAWTRVFGEILKDFYRLAVHPGDADRILVLALTRHLRVYMASSAGRYGVDLDSDRVSITAEAAAALPRSAAAVIGDELRDHHVEASRLWALDVDDDLRISVFLVDLVTGPSNSLVAFAVLPRSGASPLPRSVPVPRAAEGGLGTPSKAQDATQSSEHLSIWYQLAKCVSQLDEPFRRSEMIGWFRRHYPQTKESSLAAHIQSATANGGHATGQFSSRRPLLVRVEHGVYRRYRSEAD
jgi:hypothetical protein